MGSHDAGWLAGLPMLVLLQAVTAWYIVCARKVTREHPLLPWPRRFSWLFGAGVVLTVVVTFGPVATAAMERFSAHMVQHIVLMMVSTPLLIMGAPLLLAMRSATPEGRRRIRRVLANPIIRFLTRPLVSWIVFAAVLVCVHFTPAMDSLMGAGWLGALAEQLLYIAAAALFYITMLPGNPLAQRPRPAIRVLALFAMMIPETMTGFFLYIAGRPQVRAFEDYAQAHGQDALLDQRLGGALMWSAAMIIDVIWIAVAVHEWFESERSRTRRLDARLRHEEALPDGR